MERNERTLLADYLDTDTYFIGIKWNNQLYNVDRFTVAYNQLPARYMFKKINAMNNQSIFLTHFHPLHHSGIRLIHLFSSAFPFHPIAKIRTKISEPKLGTPPRIEPDGILSNGFMVGVTISYIIFTLSIFSIIYELGLEACGKFVKTAAAKSIAKTMPFTSYKYLSHYQLEDTFYKIDGLDDNAGVAIMNEID